MELKMVATVSISDLRKREIALAYLEEQRIGKYGELVREKTELDIALDRVKNQIRELEKCIQSLPLAVETSRLYYQSYQEILATMHEKHRPKIDLPPESEIECQVNWIDQEIDVEDSQISEENIIQIEEEIPVDENRITILTAAYSEEELSDMLAHSQHENREFQETVIHPLKRDLAKNKLVLKCISIKEIAFQEEKERILKIGKCYKEAIDSLVAPQRALPTAKTGSLVSRAISLLSLLRRSVMLVLFFLLTNSIWALSFSSLQSFYTTSYLNLKQNPQIAINDQGIAVLVWNEEKGKILNSVFKDAEGAWSIPEQIKEWDWTDDIETLGCRIDSNGNITFFWENDDESLLIIEKKLDGSYAAPTDFAKDLAANFNKKDGSGFTPIFAKNQENKKIMFWWEEDEKNDYFFLSKLNAEGSWTNPEKIVVPFLYYSREKIHVEIDSNEDVYVTIETGDNNGFFSFCRTNNQWSEFEFIDKNEDLLIDASFERPRQQNFNSVVDFEGNLMVVWEMNQDCRSVIYSAYKPHGKPWLRPAAITSPSERNFKPFLKVDQESHFVLIWNRNSNWNDCSIQGMTFSPLALEWSAPVQLSPSEGRYSATSFDLSQNGHGAIAAISYEDPFDLSIKAIMIIIDK
jgi:hypothetical protein